MCTIIHNAETFKHWSDFLRLYRSLIYDIEYPAANHITLFRMLSIIFVLISLKSFVKNSYLRLMLTIFLHAVYEYGYSKIDQAGV